MQSALVPLLSAALVIGGIVLVRQSSRLAADERQIAQDARELERLRTATRAGQALPEAPAAQPSETRPTPRQGRTERAEGQAASTRDAEIQQLTRELAEAQALAARLQTQLQDAGQARQQASAALDDLQKRSREWRDQLDGLRQQLDAARAESQAARERAAALEADNAKLKTESGAGGTRAAELRKQLATLQDLDRRRDGYLSSILRRYREITDQFRAVATDGSRGGESAASNGIALSRIQNAISLAEDEMRRLNELNTQARQIESKLPKN